MAKFASQPIGDGSGALPTDPDPNTTEPDSTRVLETPETTATPSLYTLVGLPRGGTTISVRAWVFDPTKTGGTGAGRWFAVGAAVACPVDESTDVAALPRGAKVFGQITANTGVTQLGQTIVART